MEAPASKTLSHPPLSISLKRLVPGFFIGNIKRSRAVKGCPPIAYTSDKPAGPILAAQPQVRDRPVKVFFFLKKVILPFQYLF
jgi:hypothetical protein